MEVTQSLILESISLKQKRIKPLTEPCQQRAFLYRKAFLRSHVHDDEHV